MTMTDEDVLNGLNDLLEKHKQFRYRELVSPKRKPSRLLGLNGIHLLLKLLERSSDLLSDAIYSYRENRTLLIYLVVRAHFETTANLCFFLKNLRKFYNGEINYEKMDDVLGKLTVGGKDKPDVEGDLQIPDPINIMSAIDSVDCLLRQAGAKEDSFRSSYDFLSEFCHPNFYGGGYKTRVSLENGNVIFLNNSESFEQWSGGAHANLFITANVFLVYFRESFSLLQKHEEMPTLIK